MTKPGALKVREPALEILIEVLERKELLSRVLSDTLKKYQYMEKKERAFLSRLVEGTVERAIELDFIIDRFSKTPVHKMKPVIRNILRMGVYQLKYMDRIPDSAACNESVLLAEKKGFRTLKGFVNGVLRSISREMNNIEYPDREKNPAAYLSITYSLPDWLTKKWLKDYGQDTAKAMGQAALSDSRTTLRCNLNKTSPAEYKERLKREGIKAEEGAYLPYAINVSGYDSIEKLPGYREGLFAVQDESSMLAAEAAGVTEGAKVIDLCAAPGGKSLHLAEKLKGTGMISARDLTEKKAARIEENRLRLGIDNLEILVQDALVVRESDRGTADVVIADLPCSGLGIIGKKPDIKYRITPETIKELAALQRQLLTAAAEYVKPGGVLLYSTCTVCREENIENARWFLEEHRNFSQGNLSEYLPIVLRREAEAGCLQLLPGIHESDGFFIARFIKDEV